jgi:aspartate carbamoyltransferase catalytic subunit
MPPPTMTPQNTDRPASDFPVRRGTSLRHVVESQQFTVPLLMELFERSRGMERVVARGGSLDYQNRIMATLFYAPSTRTRLSFESAMHRLGGRILSTENASAFSSEVEGEQVEDSIRIIGSYSDVIVIRHPEDDGARRAADVSPVPVINAGDGNGGQHPTQALLDLYTIYRQRPLDGLSVAIIGELDKGRTARSLAYLLAKFERVKMFFVSPPHLQMKPDILGYLDEHGVRYELESDIHHVIGEVDVVYQTRIRPERARDSFAAESYGRQTDGLRRYAIDSSVLQLMKPDALILHPLPRTVELDKSVDADPRAMYFRQARNGLFVRMALLTMLLDGDR